MNTKGHVTVAFATVMVLAWSEMLLLQYCSSLHPIYRQWCICIVQKGSRLHFLLA